MGTNSHNARIFIPDRRSFNTSSIAYVAYKWVKIPISCGFCDQVSSHLTSANFTVIIPTGCQKSPTRFQTHERAGAVWN
ncbi:unnamed protein product [Clonostachys chloroleuca]|uniref:Uncharacterized protein n=1 Tax=Clonostachys chloroleuca TaxID=1926264 RepID=A0AA35MCN3_9HYPO|nr:unnamed protein product [Clonostachys chloroleuca]